MDVFSKTQFDIVIVGAGIVGATLAQLLSQKTPALSVALVDSSARSVCDLAAFDPRVIAVSKASEALFRELDVWEKVLALRACPYFDMRVWDGEGTSSIHFNCTDIDSDNLGHIVENSVINSVLIECLTRSRNVEMIFGVKVESLNLAKNANEISKIHFDDGQSISASLIVAADGANSRLRELEDFALRRWDYGQVAIVGTIKTEKSHAFTAWQRFGCDGPLAFLPLTQNQNDDNYCSIVWSLDTDKSHQVMALSNEDFCSALAKTFEHRLGNLVLEGERHSFPLIQRHSTRYVKQGLILVGDAAHTIHPLAGQGANLGIYDVQALAKELARATIRGLPVSDISIARRYERGRQAHNLMAMSSMEGFKRLFGSDNLALRWLRNEGMRAVERAPWLKNKLSRIASGRL